MKTTTIGSILALLLTMPSLHAEDISLEGLKARMSGVYTLEEWHKDGEAFKPPQVDGRFILMNGTIMTVLRNETQPPGRVTTVLIGKYELTAERFSYGYDDISIFIEEAGATKVSHKPLWEGVRGFTPGIEGDVVHLRAENGPQELFFTSEGLDYFDKGTLLRKWRRTTDK